MMLVFFILKGSSKPEKNWKTLNVVDQTCQTGGPIAALFLPKTYLHLTVNLSKSTIRCSLV